MCVVWGCFNLNFIRMSPVSDFVYGVSVSSASSLVPLLAKYTKNVILHVNVVCFMGGVVFIVIVFVSQ